MSDKIKVLDIDIDNCTAKEAMKETMEYLKSEPVSVIEMVTVDGLMQMDELPELKENMQEFDLVLAGDKTILGGSRYHRPQVPSGDRRPFVPEDVYAIPS
ncbi:MAG: hypothetical protein ACLTLQ_17640 [[Clostridium] scindens]